MKEDIKDRFNQYLLINPSVLEAKKYNFYFDNYENSKMTDVYFGSYQKSFYNDYGKSYIVNFKFYDMSRIAADTAFSEANLSWSVDLQLKSDLSTMNIHLFNSTQTIEEFESYIDKFFKINGFFNYEYKDSEAESAHLAEIKAVNTIYNYSEVQKAVPVKPDLSVSKKQKI